MEKIAELFERDWFSAPPASEQAIEELLRVAPIQLPNSYLSLLRRTNGGEGPLSKQPYNVCLDAAEIVHETLTSRIHADTLHGFIIIGGSGGGEFIAFDHRSPNSLPVVALDITNSDLNESVLPIASDFYAFIDLIGIEPLS